MLYLQNVQLIRCYFLQQYVCFWYIYRAWAYIYIIYNWLKIKLKARIFIGMVRSFSRGWLLCRFSVLLFLVLAKLLFCASVSIYIYILCDFYRGHEEEMRVFFGYLRYKICCVLMWVIWGWCSRMGCELFTHNYFVYIYFRPYEVLREKLSIICIKKKTWVKVFSLNLRLVHVYNIYAYIWIGVLFAL